MRAPLDLGMAALFNVVAAAGGLLGRKADFASPQLRYVNWVGYHWWGAAGLVIAALLFIGYSPRHFQWGRAGLLLGFVIWLSRAWLILLVRLTGEPASIMGIAAWAFVGLMHLPQMLEPPVNPLTYTLEGPDAG